MEHIYGWYPEDKNNAVHNQYPDKIIAGGFSTKTNIGYKGWAHVIILYDQPTDQYLPVKTQGGINETPWHINTLTYGQVAQGKLGAIISLRNLVNNDPFHYDPVQVISCIEHILETSFQPHT